METKIESKLSNLPETMLITLWAKAEETKHPNALLKDEKAVEIIQRISYDFSKFNKAKISQVGCCIRANLIDREIKAFFADHPDAVAIQIGAGLDARYERLGSPTITHWYDLDLDEAIDLRKQVLQESERNTYLSCSMFDYEWIEIIKTHNKPVLIILEGLLMYFDPAQVRSFFEEICSRLDNATVLFDMLSPAFVGKSNKHDLLRKFGGKIEFKWALPVSQEMELWNPKIHFEREHYLSQHDRGRFPFIIRMLCKIPYFFRHFNQRVVRLRIS